MGTPTTPDGTLTMKGEENSSMASEKHQEDENTVSHWLIIAGCFFFVWNTLGLSLTFGVYEVYYKEHLLKDYSNSSISWIATTQTFLMVFCGVFSGVAFDHGYAVIVFIFGSILLSFGLLMVSFSTQYWSVFLSQAICMGLGASCLYTTSLSMASVTFVKRRALAQSLTTCGTAVGGAIYPIIFQQLLPRVGFSWAVRTQALLVTITNVFAIMIMASRKMAPRSQRTLIDTSAFRDVPFLINCLSMFFLCLGYWNPFNYIPSFAVSVVGTSESTGFYLLVIANACSLPGRLLPIFLKHIAAPSRLHCLSMALAAVVVFGWIGANTYHSFLAICLLWGLISGSLGVTPTATISELCPRIETMGTRIGMTWMVASFGVLIGSPVAGLANKAREDSYLGLQLFTACSLLAGAFCLIPAMVLHKRSAKMVE